MELRQGRVTANDLDIAYLEVGEGPLALCLHGFPDSAWTYRYLLPELAAAGFHAVAPWLRGYAPTAVPADGCYHSGALVEDAVALHDALGGDADAVIVGHDWGAIATYGAASLEPERWRRVVTMAVPPMGSMGNAFFDYSQIKRSFYMFFFQTPLAEVVVPANDFAFVEGLWRDWSPGYDGAEDVAHVKDALRDPAGTLAAISYYRSMWGFVPPPDRYAAAQAAIAGAPPQPTLYLHGTTDGCLDVSLAEGVDEALGADSRAELVEGAGHFLHVEKPAEVNRLIVDWVTAAGS
jgi:pimeloyl-ACP methyl ester carboxylesterase